MKMNMQDRIDWVTFAALAAIFLLTVFGPGCATVPPSPPASLCDFHKENPEANLIREQFEAACFSGHNPWACDLLNDLYKE
jgi:hypothetical protein